MALLTTLFLRLPCPGSKASMQVLQIARPGGTASRLRTHLRLILPVFFDSNSFDLSLSILSILTGTASCSSECPWLSALLAAAPSSATRWIATRVHQTPSLLQTSVLQLCFSQACILVVRPALVLAWSQPGRRSCKGETMQHNGKHFLSPSYRLALDALMA